MSKDSRELVTSTDMSKVGPDHFTFYACEVKELLSQNEDSPSLAARYEDIQSKVEANSLFKNSVGVGFSNYKNERLNSSLRQALAVLTPQVDEMGGSVVAMCKLQSEFRSRKLCSGYKGTKPEDEMRQKNLDKRIKTSSFSSTTIAKPASSYGSRTRREFQKDARKIESESHLGSNTSSGKGDEELGHMEKQLEVILDTVMSTCRPMTRTEKQQLRKLIQKLPPKNLSSVVEIVQRGKPVNAQQPDEVFVDLEQEAKRNMII